jgi:hypothetical protein
VFGVKEFSLMMGELKQIRMLSLKYLIDAYLLVE